MKTPAEERSAVVIVNPEAHNLPSRPRLREADHWLREHGWQTKWVESGSPAQSTAEAARAAEERKPLVIVCGGDGALNAVVNGLVGSETAVSVIPAGTVNLWAREVGLMKNPRDAVRLAAEGEPRRVDLGKAGSRHFLLMAGYGIDAAVARSVSRRVKGSLGAAAYAIAAAREALRYRSATIEVSLDGSSRTVEALMVLAANTRKYAGLTQIATEASVDDGLLDVCIYAGRGKPDIILHAVRTLLGRHRRSRQVTYRKVRRLELAWQEPLPLQLDGDAVPDSPTLVTVQPAALWVRVPRGLKSPLFSRR
jgi:YegS/Rv2252/BmrU family lipid kinase